MPSIRTGYGCPACQKSTGAVNEILADGGKLRCSKFTEHTWNDMADFMDLRPVMAFKQAQEAPTVQQGHTPITVNVPVRVKNAMLSRFGEKTDATVGGLLSMMAEGECLVVGETDLQRIASVMPERPKSGSHLFGMITALIYERDEAKQAAEVAAKEIKAYEGIGGTRVMIDLGEQHANAVHRAQADNLPTKVWVERTFNAAMSNNWF